MEEILSLATRHLPTLVFLGVVFLGSVVWPRILAKLRYSKIPVLNKAYDGPPEEFMFHSAALYDEGYKTLHDDMHRIVTPDGEHIVVPNRYLDELRQRPDDEVDVLTAFMKVMENDYIQLFPGHRNTRIVNSVVKQELTRALVKINPMLSRAVTETIANEMPPCDDWTPVNINRKLLRMVAIISGHVFVGPDLCHAPEYLECAVDFTTDITMAVPVVKRWWLPIRPLAKYFEPQLAKVRAHRRRMRDFLKPVIEARAAAKKRGETMPEDTLQWMLDKTDAAGITDVTELTNMQLLLTMAAIHTTTLTATFIIYDIVSRPEVVEACRKEIREVLATSDGVMTTNALFNMKLVDSVMRESQRMNPPFLDSFRRYTLKPVTLKDGTRIPAGCIIEAASKPVLMDPKLYPNPEAFDPYRFLRLRTDAAEPDPIGFGNREQYQFVSVTKENMSFGFGRHACPGRFFAANEIKLILAQLLLNYDMKLPPPPPRKEGSEDIVTGAGIGPDPTREILFRKVRV